ncbi:MAG: DegV family protein [Lachnospiraceae bacterium]|nr:DegV family protein [Lachnospiraceae bacterium]
MESFQIISDGSCDLGAELAKKHRIHVVPFYVSFDDTTYQKEIEEIPVREFYQEMVDHPDIFPKSSLPNVRDYTDAFLPYVRSGIPVLCICITSKFSGSYSAALNAKDLLLDEYPDARITVIDSTINTVLQGLFVQEAARLRDQGYSLESAVSRLEEIKSSGRIFFTIGNMDYLIHGGRVGKVMGVAGKALGIRPVITLKEGEIFPSGISRSRIKSKHKVIDLLLAYFNESGERAEDYRMVIGYGYDYSEAVSFRNDVSAALDGISGDHELPIWQIGATIGVHTGPYPIGIGILKKAL